MRLLRRGERQRGAAALEFALVAPVLILMIMGMVDLAMVMNAQAVVANAARDGARVASLGGNEAATQQAAWKSASSLGNVVALGNANANPTVSVQCFNADTTTACTGSTYDGATKPSGAVVKVTVSYVYTWITPLPNWVGLASTANIQKVSYMRIEGT